MKKWSDMHAIMTPYSLHDPDDPYGEDFDAESPAPFVKRLGRHGLASEGYEIRTVTGYTIVVGPSWARSTSISVSDTDIKAGTGEKDHPAVAERLQIKLTRRPTYILDRGYQLILGLMLVSLAFIAFYPPGAPFAFGSVLLAWGSTIYVDATVRGKSVFDVRLAAMALVFGTSALLLGLIGLISL
jgi:hypothetical protein